jgi:hypothetical protein
VSAVEEGGSIPNPDSESIKDLLLRLEQYVRWLETAFEVSPAMKALMVDQTMGLIYNRPEFVFEESMRARAKALHEDWESRNWGQGEIVEGSSDEDIPAGSGSNASKRRKSSNR